eukprot:jgi/Bigna1/80464/fgenesh1_pg.71_\
MSESKSSKNLDQVRDESEAMSQEVKCTSENKSSGNEDESNAGTLAPMDEEIKGTWFGREVGEYTLTERIGSGANGIVFLATRNGEVVAVKIQKNFEGKELRESQLDEKEGPELELMVMEDLKECPHTVNVRDRVLYRKYLHRDGTEPSETSAIVMDYCSRGMLFRYLRQFKNERIGLVQFYFKQLVTALEAMEEKKIIHRDLKPGNIMIAENGELKVIDFGNCVYGEEAKGSCGTEGYLAPEILRGAQYSSKVDIYSAGVILFEMLYGFNPELGTEGKRDFWERSTRYTGWLIKRGVLKREFPQREMGSAQQLLTYLDGSNIR